MKILLFGKGNLQNYINAIEGVGAEAIAEYPPKIDHTYDGLILCGGVDIHPKWYNEEINGTVNIDEKRDASEFKLVQAFIDAKKPIMGICRGCQLLNVAFGGTLYQDIENSKEHSLSLLLSIRHQCVWKQPYLFLCLHLSCLLTIDTDFHYLFLLIGLHLQHDGIA